MAKFSSSGVCDAIDWLSSTSPSAFDATHSYGVCPHFAREVVAASAPPSAGGDVDGPDVGGVVSP